LKIEILCFLSSSSFLLLFFFFFSLLPFSSLPVLIELLFLKMNFNDFLFWKSPIVEIDIPEAEEEPEDQTIESVPEVKIEPITPQTIHSIRNLQPQIPETELYHTHVFWKTPLPDVDLPEPDSFEDEEELEEGNQEQETKSGSLDQQEQQRLSNSKQQQQPTKSFSPIQTTQTAHNLDPKNPLEQTFLNNNFWKLPIPEIELDVAVEIDDV